MSEPTPDRAADARHRSRVRLARFLFQSGLGAVAASLVWCFLTTVDWRPDRPDLLPLTLFAVALPGFAFCVPAHIVSSAIASGRILMAVSVLLALLALAVSAGRLIFSWDRVLVVLLAGLIVSAGVLAQSLWGRIRENPADGNDRGWMARDGILSCGGWFAGIGLAPLVSLAGHPHYGLWFGAAALVAGGWLVRRIPWKNAAASWLSNRSALRLFSAIENALRFRRPRMLLVRVFWFSGALLVLIAMIPGGWSAGSGGGAVAAAITGGVTEDASFTGFVLILLALTSGLAFGGFPPLIRWWAERPFPVQLLLCLSIPVAGLGVVLLPGAAKVIPAFVIGAGGGAVMGEASRDLKALLGPIFESESEILLSTVAGAGGIAFSACFWLAHSIVGFGSLLLIAELLLFTGFAVAWHRRGAESGSDSEKPERTFDPWYPGKFGRFAEGKGEEAVLVSVAYEISPENRGAFSEAIRDLARLRQRQGAFYWTLVESADHPEILKEQFIIESLSAYRNAVRAETAADRQIKQRVFDLNHWDSLPTENRHPLLEAC